MVIESEGMIQAMLEKLMVGLAKAKHLCQKGGRVFVLTRNSVPLTPCVMELKRPITPYPQSKGHYCAVDKGSGYSLPI